MLHQASRAVSIVMPEPKNPARSQSSATKPSEREKNEREGDREKILLEEGKRPRLGWDVLPLETLKIKYTARWVKGPLVRFWSAGIRKEKKWLPLKLFVE
ncbi:Hypothetical predicted protein [Olea europaea subsp. europaea]|uniref:Uncharacterized protein n=1 Tax=Olea europaea subsp. europaea TaxID=158383 RepID=A0A8S0R3Q8_OLEEU|nr:Hypothetical predicted protein [Olea europaea subsp. europaea]